MKYLQKRVPSHRKKPSEHKERITWILNRVGRQSRSIESTEEMFEKMLIRFSKMKIARQTKRERLCKPSKDDTGALPLRCGMDEVQF